MIATAKSRILSAGRILFAEHGYSGTSTAKIAKLAEVNHSLIFHHFGSKERLWVEVKLSIVREAKQVNSIVPSIDLAFSDFLRELVKNSINFYQKNPDITRMILWQQLEHTNTDSIGITRSEETTVWIAAIQYYQELGIINPKLNTAYVVSYMLAIVCAAALNQNKLIDDLNEYIDFCVERLRKSFI